jgi:hypothetical protein
MDKFTDSGGRPWPGRGPRRARAVAAGALLAALGAVLRFALTARSRLGLDVHDIGVILILAGLAVMLLPGAAYDWLGGGWLRIRWVNPGQARPYPRARPGRGVNDGGQAAAAGRPDAEPGPPPDVPPGEGA